MLGELGLSEPQARSFAQANGAINVWDGAVRSGKTVASLLKAGQFVADPGRQRGGGVFVVTGVTQDTIARNVFAPLSDPAIMGRHARLTHYTRGAPTGVILGRPVEVISGYDLASERRIRGLTAYGWYADEFNLLPEEFMNQLVARASVAGARGFATCNPAAPGHWAKKRYIDTAWQATGPDVRHWHFKITDNPSLGREYLQTMMGLYTGMWYKRMILGLWVMAEGAVFDSFDPERHVVSDPELPDIQQWLAVGIDYGTTNPFSAVLIGLGADQRLYVTHEYRYDSRKSGRAMTDREYSAAVRGWLDGIEYKGTKGVRPRFVFVDPSAASFRLQLHRDGLTNIAGDNGVTDGLRTMSSLFTADKIRIHERCAGLVEEIPGYSWDPKEAKLGNDAPIKRDDHSVDAARYGIRTSEGLWFSSVYSRLKTPTY